MGVIDFIVDKGKDLLGMEGDDSETIKNEVQNELPDGIQDLMVDFSNGLAILSGNCVSQEAKEKAILLTGNIKGISEVNEDGLIITDDSDIVETEYYTIQSGDTLSKIAANYYGDAMKYPVIFEANREVIKDPDLIYPGQKIRIPL